MQTLIEASKPVVAAKPAKTPVVKVADKVATKAKATPAKAAAKGADKSKASKTPKAVAGIKFAIVSGHRPASGGELFAHTQAVFELTGMDKGKGADKSLLAFVMGETAVRYNIKEGKFALVDGKVSLTPAGKSAMIEARKGRIDSALVESFKEVLQNGTTNSRIKNKDMIRAVAA